VSKLSGWWQRTSRGERIRTVIAFVGGVMVVMAFALADTGHPNQILLSIGWIVLVPTLIASIVVSRRRSSRGD
jgi:peptidoglycan/LPS O-acetylase OafA/YrhL